MENKQSNYKRMYEIIEKIQVSDDVDEMLELVKEYRDLNIESRNEVDFDYKNHPDNSLELTHMSLELRIKNYEIKQKIIRESLDSGSTEYTEDNFDEYDNKWHKWVKRSDFIHYLICDRIELNKEWLE